MKWIWGILMLVPGALFAQLPIPLTPDWLKSEKESGILHATHVQLTENNYRLVQTNLVAKSGGFKLLGFITIKSPSYVQAVGRLYARAQIKEGRSQALANLVYESGGLNLIVFSLPKIRVCADLIEFTSPGSSVGPERVLRRESSP